MAFHKHSSEPTMVKSTIKFNSKCAECEEKIYAGDEYYYDFINKKVYCVPCGIEMNS